MATVSTFLEEVRYDLRDFGKQDFDDPQLLIYFNRAVTVLDTELMRLRSDYTATEGTVTLTAGEYEMDMPALCSTVRSIFNEQTEKYEITWDHLTKRRVLWNSAAGQPVYWSQRQRKVQWERIADIDYDFTVTYDAWTGTLTETDDMPYNDEFNNYLVQGTTLQANASKKDTMVPTDTQLHTLFRGQLARDVIVRNFRKRPYTMDF
jgi:hypothetical protein